MDEIFLRKKILGSAAKTNTLENTSAPVPFQRSLSLRRRASLFKEDFLGGIRVIEIHPRVSFLYIATIGIDGISKAVKAPLSCVVLISQKL